MRFPLTVTHLLVDRSWGNRVNSYFGQKKICFPLRIPFSGIRARSIRSIVVRLDACVYAGVEFTIVTLRALVSTAA